MADITDRAIKIGTSIAGLITALSSAVVKFTEDVNIIKDNTTSWNWVVIVPFAFLVLCLSGLIWLTLRNKNKVCDFVKKILPSKKRANSKVDMIKEWFDDYIKSGEATQYMKTLGDKSEQDFKISQMYESLSKLQEDGEVSGELESKLYYLYIFSLLHGSKTRVWAVSMGSEWNDSEEEKEFLRMNFEVARRKIHLERIFVIERGNLDALLKTDAVIKQIEKRDTYYKTFIAFKEDIDEKKPNLYNQLGCGFLAFDDFAIADDRFVDNDIRGFIHTSKANYKDFNTKFTELRDFAYVLDEAFVKNHENIQH